MSEGLPNSMIGSEVVDLIQNFSKFHNLREKAESACWACLRSGDTEGVLDGYNLEEFQVVFGWSGLVVEHHSLTYPFLEIHFRLYVTDPLEYQNRKRIGYYAYRASLDGQFADEYLVFNPKA